MSRQQRTDGSSPLTLSEDALFMSTSCAFADAGTATTDGGAFLPQQHHHDYASQAATPVRSSPHNNSPHHHHHDGLLLAESFSPRFECPLSSRCRLDLGDNVAKHLEDVHGAKRYAVPCDKAGKGEAEMDSPINVRPGPPRRSAVLLEFGGAVFVWTLEVRLRADAELQASVAVQLLDEEVWSGGGGGGASVAGVVGGKFRVSISTDKSKSKATQSTQQEQQSTTAAINSNNNGAIMSWTGVLSSSSSSSAPSSPSSAAASASLLRLQRHDRLVSRGEGMVCLHPANKEVFVEVREGEMTLKVQTTLVRV